MNDLDHVLRVSGASYRQIDFWVRKGYLNPEGGTGSGSQRYWPGDEVRAATFMKRLVDNGVQPAAAAHAARNDGTLPGGARVLIDEEIPA